MTSVTLYHNPRCSKSRHALEMLQNGQHDIELRLYLEKPLCAEEICCLKQQADIRSLREIMRVNDDLFTRVVPENADEATLLTALVEHPALLERPIAVVGNRAAVGRPWENIAALLEE